MKNFILYSVFVISFFSTAPIRPFNLWANYDLNFPPLSPTLSALVALKSKAKQVKKETYAAVVRKHHKKKLTVNWNDPLVRKIFANLRIKIPTETCATLTICSVHH